jgi:GntR family transcriptional regulator
MKLIQVPKDRPLYTVVRDKIQELINQGTYPPGSQLPPEMELTQQLGVSRVILREALRALEEDNVLLRRQGVGTFVNRPIPLARSDLHINYSVTEIVELNGLTAGISDLVIERCLADEFLADKLQLRVGDPVVRIERVRTADGRPVAYTVDYVPEAVLELSAIEEALGNSLYQLLEKRGHHIKDGWARLAPAKAGYVIAEKLGINPDSVTLLIEQVDYDADQHPLVFSWEYHLRQAFEFTIYRVRVPEPGVQAVRRSGLAECHPARTLQPPHLRVSPAPATEI